MENKLTNTLIVFILVIVLGLGGIYFYKIVAQPSHTLNAQSNEFYENNQLQEDIASKETLNTNIESNSNVQSTTQEVSQNHIVIELPKEDNNKNTVAEVPSTEKSETQSIISTYEYNNRYYYNQLDNYSKPIYDAIVNNIGSNNIEIDYDFTALLNQSDGQEKLNNYYDDAINAINLDVPNLFYVDFSKMYLNIETTTTLFATNYRLYIDAGSNTNYFANGFSSQTQIKKAINEVENIKNEICKSANTNEYGKLRNPHDWMIENLSYNSDEMNKNNIYGALVNKKAVCEGYARAYKYILDELGIINILVVGTSTNSSGTTEDHMWNYVSLNNKWYAVDVTWDDPIVQGNGIVSYETKYKYFLVGSNELFKNHVEKNTISSTGKIFTLPTLSTVKY